MTDIRPKDLPVVTAPTAADKILLDGATTRSIDYTNLYRSGPFATAVPTTKTTNYSMLAADSSLVFNGSGTITLTLLAASSVPGQWLHVKTVAAQAVVSATSNVVPLAGGAAGTSMLAATAGRWLSLQSDGTNWISMAGG